MNRRSTPPSPSGSPRWGSVATYAALGALGATILAACQPSTGLDISKPLSDGTRTAQSNADDQGSVGTITITVEGGRITATSYETTLADGTDKGSDYGKSSAGEVFNEDYYKKAQAAVASYQEYSSRARPSPTSSSCRRRSERSRPPRAYPPTERTTSRSPA